MTAKDKLGDPAGWDNVPADLHPPNDSYVLARLASVVPDGQSVIIVFEANGETYPNVIEMDSVSEASHVTARIQQDVGQLLLEALKEPVSL